MTAKNGYKPTIKPRDRAIQHTIEARTADGRFLTAQQHHRLAGNEGELREDPTETPKRWTSKQLRQKIPKKKI